MLEIKVSDTGTGLLKKYYEKMFTPLAQADPSKVLKSGGAGLGLYIVKNLIDLHGRENLCGFRGWKRQYIYLYSSVIRQKVN